MSSSYFVFPIYCAVFFPVSHLLRNQSSFLYFFPTASLKVMQYIFIIFLAVPNLWNKTHIYTCFLPLNSWRLAVICFPRPLIFHTYSHTLHFLCWQCLEISFQFGYGIPAAVFFWHTQYHEQTVLCLSPSLEPEFSSLSIINFGRAVTNSASMNVLV